MGGNPSKAELRRLVRQTALGVGAVNRGGVPVKCCIHVVKETGAHHVHLPRTAFLSGSAVEADSARTARLIQPVLHCKRGSHGPGTEQIVTAGLPVGFSIDGRGIGHSCLRDARQRIEFSENGDHWPALAIACNKGSRYFGNAFLDTEALFRQQLLQDVAALGLEIAQL